jgi:hypothetical protein
VAEDRVDAGAAHQKKLDFHSNVMLVAQWLGPLQSTLGVDVFDSQFFVDKAHS